MKILPTTDHLSRFYQSSSSLICFVLIMVSYLMFTSSLHGQEVPRKPMYRDQVLTINGSRFVGEIQEIKDGVVILKLVSGGIVPLNLSDVKRIYQHVPSGGTYSNDEPTFMDYHNRYFFGLDMGMSFSTANSREYFGYEIGGSVKRKLNSRHLIGLRNTLKFYNSDVGLTVNDIKIEYNYLLSKPRKVTPYTSVRLGTGFVFRNDEWRIRNQGFSLGGG